MTLEAFRERYGQAFYGFINSELGQAMIETLKANDPTGRITCLSSDQQVSNAVLFLGQITGFNSAVAAIQSLLIVGPEGPLEVEADYEAGNDDDVKRFLAGKPKPEPTIPKTKKRGK